MQKLQKTAFLSDSISKESIQTYISKSLQTHRKIWNHSTSKAMKFHLIFANAKESNKPTKPKKSKSP